MERERAWWKREGLVYVGMWEPSYFIKQLGRPFSEAEWEYRHSAEYVRELHRRGVNHIWTHHWKGYGLKFERAEQERNRPLVAEAHRLGMRVVAYCTFGTIVPETLAHEAPDCEAWAQLGENGQPASYGYAAYQCFRVRPCYNAQPWLDYLKRVVDVALLELDMDGIHFDNVYTNPEPDACHCPRCVAGFRAFLAREFGGGSDATRQLGERLFGHTDFRFAKAPWFNRWNLPVMQRQVRVSIQQAWVRYKAEILRDALRQMSDHIRGVKPGALVEANAGKGIGSNMEYLNSLCPEIDFPLVDLVFDEGAQSIGIGPNGQWITRIREYKQARAAGISAICYCRADALRMAEAFAFNSGAVGDGSSAALNAWYHERKRYQLEAETLSEVAVLRHRESLAFNMIEPHAAVITAEQVLIENRVPFDIVWGRQLADLSKYRVLVLAGVECLAAEEAAAIVRFVEMGGALLAIGPVGEYDLWRRPHLPETRSVTSAAEAEAALRPRNALRALFGDAPSEPARVIHGRGRAAFLPGFEYRVFPSGGTEFWTVSPQWWAMPRNEAAVTDTLRWCFGGPPRLRVETDGKVVVEHTRVGAEEVVHLVHVEGREKTTAARISVRRGQGTAEALVAEFGGPLQPAPFSSDGDGWTTVEVPSLAIHRMLVLR